MTALPGQAAAIRFCTIFLTLPSLKCIAHDLAIAGQSEAAREALSTAKDIAKFVAVEGLVIAIPPVGVAISAIELVTGKSAFDGEELTPFQRALAGVNLLSFGAVRGFQSAARMVAKLAVRPGRVGEWARRMLMRVKAADQAVKSKPVVGAGKSADERLARIEADFAARPRTEWSISNVQDHWRQSGFPRQFDLKLGDQVIKVKPNGSKHINDHRWNRMKYSSSQPQKDQGWLPSLASAVEDALEKPLSGPGRHPRAIGDWELGIEKMEDGSLELFHAVYKP